MVSTADSKSIIPFRNQELKVFASIKMPKLSARKLTINLSKKPLQILFTKMKKKGLNLNKMNLND